MKFRSYTYLLGALAVLLSACQKEEQAYTVGEADNAIVLSAGVVGGGVLVQTKAIDGNHETHVLFSENTKMRLQVIGDWWKKDAATATSVVKTTEAAAGSIVSNTDSKHRELKNYSPVLYWDDYGTADPNNAGVDKGRKKGLTIYGVAINGSASLHTDISSLSSDVAWTTVDWTLPDDQSTSAGDWSKVDLLVSNNVQAGKDGTLKFDDWKDNTASNSNLLEFKHAMSKITVNLKANKGFPTTGSNLVGNTVNKFENNPSVTLLSRSAGNEIAYVVTKGTVDITTGTVTPSSDPSDTETVVAKLDNVHAEWPAESSEFMYTVQLTALVCPGTVIGADPDDSDSDPMTPTAAEQKTIAKIEVDGNVYYLNAQKISAALKTANSLTDYTTEPGKNYILNVTVDKTEVHVDATIADWEDVVAEVATPKIDVNSTYGSAVNGNQFSNDFSLYYNDRKEYVASGSHYYGTSPSSGYYGEERYYNASTNKLYSGSSEAALYWPNHEIKYFFRGIWPRTINAETETEKFIKTSNTNSSQWRPAVEVFEDNSESHQGIYVKNTEYIQNTFPSDLLLGMPIATGAQAEPAEGISATEGTITLNFGYKMAQVEVRLISSGAGQSDNVDFGNSGTGGADQAVVKILNGFNDGYINIADGTSYCKTVGEYALTPVVKPGDSNYPTALPTADNYSHANYGGTFWTADATKESAKANVRHDSVLPQSLTNGTNPLKFEITTGSDALKHDKYTIDIKDIDVITGGQGTSKITEWEAGKHYIYTLRITKTQITMEATIEDWVPVVAGGDFWL